jgi:hypothetical protein
MVARFLRNPFIKRYRTKGLASKRWEERDMLDNNKFESYIQPYCSTLQTLNKNKQGEFSKELLVFLEQHPNFLTSQSHLQCFCYCFDHYINYDPASRDLPLQEKIKQAGEMAIKFLGFITRSTA